MPDTEYKLVTVNTSPERATRVIRRMTTALSDRYKIIHLGNCESIEDVASKIQQFQPDILFCASMWTAAEAEAIQSTARAMQPGVITYALPHGLQVTQGPDAVVQHLVDNVPKLLEKSRS